jgi:BirA family transcriptional regulator, biotin operon repressor / biotin---[acetyl-CoA-carboxylase] ligase
MTRLGRPRLHLREIGSTNERARELASVGVPAGTLVTASSQTEGRGRQGRRWFAPAGSTLLLSLVLREPDPLLSLRAGLAVADLAGPDAQIKWPNDVLLHGRKLAGVLVESRPQEGWSVLGIGVNVALDVRDLPPELRESAATLGRDAEELESALAELLAALEGRLAEPAADAVTALRARDALLGRPLTWVGGRGTGAGIDEDGGLCVELPGGGTTVLRAGEVHLAGANPSDQFPSSP